MDEGEDEDEEEESGARSDTSVLQTRRKIER